jgi:hypothetical protein
VCSWASTSPTAVGTFCRTVDGRRRPAYAERFPQVPCPHHRPL